MVVTGVADQAPERIRTLVYLDAFVPQDGQSLVDLLNAQARTAMLGTPGWQIAPRTAGPGDDRPGRNRVDR